jgi:hypothetical protein
MIVHQRAGFDIDITTAFLSINIVLDYMYYDTSMSLNYVARDVSTHLVI